MSDGDGDRGGDGRGGAARGGDARGYLFLAAMVIIGSSTAPAARFAVGGLPAGFLPIARFGLAGLCLLPMVGRRDLWRLVREDKWRLAASAALGVPVNQTFFLNGARLTSTAHVALIYAACPLVVLLLASALGQERLTRGRLAGVLASVLGVGVIALDGLWRGGPSAASALRGDLLTAGAVVSWGAYLTASKPLVVRHGALATLSATFLLGVLLHLPVAALTYPTWTPLAAAPASAWLGLAYLTLVVSVVGLTFQNLALRRFDASQVATAGNAAPVLTVLQGVWLFGETLSPALVLGGLLTLGGIVRTSRPPTSAAGPSGPQPADPQAGAAMSASAPRA